MTFVFSSGGSLTKLAYYSTVQHKVAKVRSFDHTAKVMCNFFFQNSNNCQNPSEWIGHACVFSIVYHAICGSRFHCMYVKMFLFFRRHLVTSYMKYQCKKRSLHACILSSLKMLTLKHVWTLSKIIWSTQKPKLLKPRVEEHTSSKILLSGNLDSSKYWNVLLYLYKHMFIFIHNILSFSQGHIIPFYSFDCESPN